MASATDQPSRLARLSTVGSDDRSVLRNPEPVGLNASSPLPLADEGPTDIDAGIASQNQESQKNCAGLAIPSPNCLPASDLPLRSYADLSDEHKHGPWAKKTVLSFDGGGVRGYSSLLILRCLMEKIRNIEEKLCKDIKGSGDYPWMEKEPARSEEDDSAVKSAKFLPCHYFDYITGTSTGGLSAIMLGRLRMSTDESLATYVAFGNAVFGKARWWHERSLLWLPRAKYPSRKIRQAILTVISSRLKQQDPGISDEKADRRASRELYESPDYKTRTIVFSTRLEKLDGLTRPHLWRTYDHIDGIIEDKHRYRHMNPCKAHHEPLWQVARATTAAPTFFESIKIGNDKHFDGAIGANNPAFLAFSEIRQKEYYDPGVFLSIGTGIKKIENDNETPRQGKAQKRKFVTSQRVDEISRKQFVKKYLELFRVFKDLSVDTEETHNQWLGACDPKKTKRCRFNVDEGLGPIPLDDWRPPRSGEDTLRRIRELTESYLALEDTQANLDEYAEHLVRLRRSRAETERWESFAANIEYFCPFPACADKDACRYYQGGDCRNRLRRHVKYVHEEFVRSHPDDLEAFLDAGRLLSAPRSKKYERTYDILRSAASTGLSDSSHRN